MMRFAVAAFCLAALPCRGQICAPSGLEVSGDGRRVYVACSERRTIEFVDPGTGKTLRSVALPARPAGLTLSPDGASLYVACVAPASSVLDVDAATGRIRSSLAAGYSAQRAVPSRDGKTLYAVNRFGGDVWILDVLGRRLEAKVKVVREPMDAALTPDGKWLFVANALPAMRADVPPVAARVSVIDTAARRPAESIQLPNGSTGLRSIRMSHDGKWAAVTHILARYYLPTTQLDRGWMTTNAVSLIDVPSRRLAATILLDNIGRGAANPWAVAWTPDGKRLLVTHAGTHELSVIDVPALLAKLAQPLPAIDPADDLSFLAGLRRRVALSGKGPRAMAVAGSRVFVAGYFSDTLETLDLERPERGPEVLARFSRGETDAARRGEMLFNDGSIGFQGWQSCATCHSFDARVDGLNWDLLNDGIGNPKNVKSLLLSHRTPPVMSEGVRENAEYAVRAGLRLILFAQRPDEDAAAIDAYLKSLAPMASPALVKGRLPDHAERGRKLFFSGQTGCATCHPAGLFTDLQSHDVGTRSQTDRISEFDTPTLVELWRTAPYLHDGSAASLREVLTVFNKSDRHGKTSHLTASEIGDLAEFLGCL
ncbi:MAG: cell surface protein [Acidobacteria bacterium]|nr:cell surface protein [Acidobacteriota bacterium]